MPAMALLSMVAIAAAAPVARRADAFFSAVGSTPRIAPPDMSMPSMPGIEDMSMPMSFMSASGRLRKGGTSPAMPARGASVARAIPERSMASPTRV